MTATTSGRREFGRHGYNCDCKTCANCEPEPEYIALDSSHGPIDDAPLQDEPQRLNVAAELFAIAVILGAVAWLAAAAAKGAW